jgi:hypothetical protein
MFMKTSIISCVAVVAFLAIQLPSGVDSQPSCFTIPGTNATMCTQGNQAAVPAVDNRIVLAIAQIVGELQRLNDLIARLLATNVANNGNAIDPAIAALLAAFSSRDGDRDRDDKPSIVKIPTGNNNYGYGRSSAGSSASENPVASDEKSKYFNTVKNIGDLLNKNKNNDNKKN